MNNIFLTGEKQIGKSTIINRIIQDFSGKICGFKTLLEKNEHRQFYFYSLNSNFRIDEKVYICKKSSNNKLEGISESFDKTGVEILRDCINSSQNIIIMDELGTFENDAYKFHEAVYECLNSKYPVVGVIKDKSSLFLDTIKKRKDVEVHYITKDNRDAAYKNIRNALKNLDLAMNQTTL